MTIEISALTGFGNGMPAARPIPGQTTIEGLLFETLLTAGGIRDALLPPSLHLGMYGDIVLQQLAQQIAGQFRGQAPGQPYQG